MIGQIITGPDGNPSAEAYSKLSKSAYQPPLEVKQLWTRIQKDYQVAYMLQHRSFDEFDGYSLLQRAKLDQETFAAYVGCEFVPKHKQWRFKGRKNTARNKLINICARMLAGILYPMVSARNEQNEEDKMTARVMKIRIENHLKKAGYTVKFMFMILSALVNPAVMIHVEWVEFIQKIKTKMNGKVKIEEIVNEMLSGLQLNILPVDEIMFCDFYSGTGNVKVLPVVLRVRRIPWDEARAKWAGKCFNEKGEDLFGFVQAGMTRIVLTGNENQELFDIEWTEADRNYVQEIIAYYPYEDLEVPVVGGVLMVDETDVYNSNPFEHRRYQLVGDEWKSVPVLPIAMSGFEPIDPAGRFLYYKSGAFKEFWDDLSLNTMSRLAHDATYLDTFPPAFLSGVTKVDSTVMVPGGAFGMPAGATVDFKHMNPNIQAVYENIQKQEQDMGDSTTINPAPQTPQSNIPATQTNVAVQQAKLYMTVFATLIADLVTKIGELVIDIEVEHACTGEIDEKIPGRINLKDKVSLIKGKDKGKSVTNKIVFTSKHMGKNYTKQQIEDKQWELFNKSGSTPEERYKSDQRTYEVDPYKYARTIYSVTVDADEIVDRSLGADKQRKMTAFNVLTDPRVSPWTDQEAVVDDFAIQEYGGDDPDKYKRKQQPLDPSQMMGAVTGQGQNASPGQFKLGGGAAVPSSQGPNPMAMV